MNALDYTDRSTTGFRSRVVEQVIAGQETSDGAGVKLTRVLGPTLQRRLDPFLLLDVFASDNPDDYIAGFPDHPHRGFETVTYLIAGRMRHRDNAGHQGLLRSGGAQWMTAGRGIVHSEMPEQENGVLEGFQLWLNLPARDKMGQAGYRDIQSEEIPAYAVEGVTVRAIAGNLQGLEGAVQRPVTEPVILDLSLPAGSRYRQTLPVDDNAFLYVYRGEISVEGSPVRQRHLAILSNREGDEGVLVESPVASRLLLIAGRPLKEPIVQQGPFVMNSQEEIVQAYADYRAGRFAPLGGEGRLAGP